MNPTLASQVRRAESAITEALQRHASAALCFSGGKDSVVLAHLLKPYSDRLTMLWTNTGAGLPHMTQFVRAYADRFRLVELSTNQEARFAKVGLPSRLVPIYNTPLGLMAEFEPQNRLMLTDWLSCCWALRWQPINEYVAANSIRLLFYGQRRDENTKPLNAGDGVEFVAPLWDWTEADVLGYATANGLALPEQYREISDSFDCCTCPASATKPRMAYLEKRYPELHARTRAMVEQIDAAIITEIEKLWGIKRPTPTRKEAA